MKLLNHKSILKKTIMKKLITICILVVTLLVGGMTVEAKTTKKKSQARTTQTTASTKEFGPDIFLKKGKYSYSMSFRSDIRNSLSQLGFTRKGNIYSKKGIRVELYSRDEIIITFANQSEMDKFIMQTAKLGYEWNGEVFKTGYFEIDIWVEDNKIEMMVLRG